MDRIPGGRVVLGLAALVGLPALWLVPEEAEVGLWGGEADPEAVETWGEALGRVGRLLVVSEGVVLAGSLGLLVLSLGAQFRRVGECLRVRDALVEWVVHLALVMALGATYVGVLGVVLALRRLEGRRATVLALVIVARVAFPLLGPVLCLDGGWAWVKAGWAASRRIFL